MNRIAVFAIDPRAKRLVVPTRRFVRRLFRLLKLKSSAVEIYLVGHREMRKNVLAYPAPPTFPRLRGWFNLEVNCLVVQDKDL